MSSITNIQNIIDEHKTSLPEGSYLELCKEMKLLFEERNEYNYYNVKYVYTRTYVYDNIIFPEIVKTNEIIKVHGNDHSDGNLRLILQSKLMMNTNPKEIVGIVDEDENNVDITIKEKVYIISYELS